jgi:hypothetical protein
MHDDDLTAILAHLQRGRSRWFYPPYSAEEIDAHPERERITATLEAAIAEALKLEDERVEATVELAVDGATVQ